MDKKDRMDKLRNLKRKLSLDRKSALYLVDNLNNTILKKLNKSNYHKDILFKKLYKNPNNRKKIEIEKPIFTPFTRRKNDEQSTLLSFNGPLQRMHIDIADLRFLNPSASEPKYVLVIVDLFSSFTYIVPLSNRGNLNKAVEIFYDNIQNDRITINKSKKKDDIAPLYIQSDMEFQRNDIKLLNMQYNVVMYTTKMNSGHAFAAEQKIRELKKILTKQSRIFGKRRQLQQNLNDAAYQMNLTINPKYNVKPGKVKKKNN